jgi:hypothetical protein
MLGDVELQLVQDISINGDQVLEQHAVPALEGDFLQRLGRRATRIELTGVLLGTDVRKSLNDVRAKFRAAEPVTFVADIATATRVGQVLIEDLGVRELAGTPERYEYALGLREFIPPPKEATEGTSNVDASAQTEGLDLTGSLIAGLAALDTGFVTQIQRFSTSLGALLPRI